MRVFVTGAEGFVGHHLVDLLFERGHQVVAGILENVHASFGHSVRIVHWDLLNRESVSHALESTKPEGLIHLAAQSSVPRSWEDPAQTFMVNTVGTITLLEEVHLHVPECRVITVGSGEEYGFSAQSSEALSENQAFFPQNPYATSKLAMGLAALQLAKKMNLSLAHVRAFNHFGPGQREGFVVSDFASQIARIETATIPPVLQVGDLEAQRDFTDVRDVVRAYLALLENDQVEGICNVCSGIPRKIQEIVDVLVSFSRVPIRIEKDPGRLRSSEVPVFVGSPEKIHQMTGWRPVRVFEESLRETIDWWRQKYRNEEARKE